MIRKWPLGVAGIIAGMLTGGVLLAFDRSSQKSLVPLHVVTSGPFERRVTAEGYLEAESSTPVSAPVEADGPLKIAWLADDQSLVKKGDLIVQFDASDFEESLRGGNTQRTKADNTLRKADVESLATRNNLQRDAGQAETELQTARTFMQKDPDVFSRYQVIESGIEEELSLERRNYALRVQQIRAELSSANRDLISIEQRKADLKIGKAQRGLQALVIAAPHDGLIVFKRDWRGELPRPGATAWAGSPLGEIPIMSTMRVQLFVLEADAGGIEVGQKTIVRLDSNPRIGYDAIVEHIDKMAKPRTRGVPVQYFGVRLKLAKTDPATMKPGARLRATIELAREKHAITIPRQAIFEKDGAKIVYVQKGKTFEARKVVPGVSSAGKTLITRGLMTGEEIALENPVEREGGSQSAEGKGVA